MNKNIKVKIGLSIAGTIIGAGFATGKEIIYFFNGNSFFYTVLLALSIIVMTLTTVAYHYLIKNDKLPKILDIFFYLFSAGGFAIMLACGGQTIVDSFQIPNSIGVIITYLISIIIIKFGINAVFKFNQIVTPFIILLLLSISIIGISEPVFYNYSLPIFSSLTYAGYNLLSILPFIKSISKDSNYHDEFYGIIIGFVMIIIVSIAIKILINMNFNIIENETIPIFKIVSLKMPSLTYIYSGVLYLSVLTTSISTLFVITRGKNIWLISLPLLLVSFLGFTTLLEKVYTYFGYIGIIIIIYLLVKKGLNYGKRNE